MSMFLSDEQMRVVNAGFKPEQTQGWSIIPLPVGPMPVPAWAKDLHVNWMEQFANSPNLTLKTNSNLRDWPDQRFERDGSMFISKHPDGRAEIYYQNGPLSMATVKRFRAADGTLKNHPNIIKGGKGVEAGEWVEVERLCTRQEQGFGGSHYDIEMTDGTQVVLRGPWHGGAPSGYTELAYVNTVYYKNHYPRWKTPWYKRGGTGGLYLTDDVFINIFARFCPHLPLARVNEGFGCSLQPMKPEWDVPKAWIYEAERQVRIALKRAERASDGKP